MKQRMNIIIIHYFIIVIKNKFDSFIIRKLVPFKLIGYFQNGNMKYYFNHQSIPYEILKLINYLR